MSFLKIKHRFSSHLEILKGPRLLYSINLKKKFTIIDLRKLYFAQIYAKKMNGSLILQNRNHPTKYVKGAFTKA